MWDIELFLQNTTTLLNHLIKPLRGHSPDKLIVGSTKHIAPLTNHISSQEMGLNVLLPNTQIVGSFCYFSCFRHNGSHSVRWFCWIVIDKKADVMKEDTWEKKRDLLKVVKQNSFSCVFFLSVFPLVLSLEPFSLSWMRVHTFIVNLSYNGNHSWILIYLCSIFFRLSFSLSGPTSG